MMAVAFLVFNVFANTQEDLDNIKIEREQNEKLPSHKYLTRINDHSFTEFKKTYKDLQTQINDRLSIQGFNDAGITNDPKDLSPIRETTWYFLYDMIYMKFDDIVAIGKNVQVGKDNGVYLPCLNIDGKIGIATYMSRPVVPNPYIFGPVFNIFISGNTMDWFYQFQIDEDIATGFYMHITHEGRISNTYPLAGLRISDPPEPEPSDSLSNLYFPHIASNNNWETEICIINTSDQELKGSLKPYNSEGNLLSVKIIQEGDGSNNITIPAYGRKVLLVGDEFLNSQDIKYMIFSSEASGFSGYSKLYREGVYRVAIPAVEEINTDKIYIPHIASNDRWWTGLYLVNTNNSEKTFNIEFNNGETKRITMAAGGYTCRNIKSFFGGVPQPDIKSAVITDAEGIIGLELFSSRNQLSGISLTDKTANNLYFPHIATNERWWTGIAACNPNNLNANLTITSYTENGVVLDVFDINLPRNGKLLGNAKTLNLVKNTAWLKIESSQPLNGFELFGTGDGKILAGYSTVNINRKEGIFPKIENEGWTGIAFINTTNDNANITLILYDNDGFAIAEKDIVLGGHEKLVDNPRDIFAGPINTGTYIKFSANRDVVGFQLNGSSDGMMLDALPGM
jgi:hypothetical protein